MIVKKTRFQLAAVGAAATLLAACATLAVSLFQDFKVNGETVPAAYQQGLYADQLAAGKADGAELRAAVKNLAVERFALRQEADKEGLSNDPVVQRRIEAARLQILTSALANNYLKANPVTDGDVLVAYNRAQIAYGDKEYQVRQIFVKDEAQMKRISEALKKPESFAALAAAKADDKVLAGKQGDMGWLSASAFKDPALADIVKKTPAGTNSQVFKSNAGWHFLRVEAVRKAQNFPSLDKARAGIARELAQQRAADYLKSIVQQAKTK